MDKKLYLIGFRFGKREVIGYGKWNNRICKCDCGSVQSVSIANIKKGVAKSCGKCLGEINDSKRIGQRQGRLVIMRELATLKSGKYKIRFEVKCDCGNIILVDRCFRTLSCGCSRMKYMNRVEYKAILSSWRAMHQRCYNPKHRNFKYYGLKGITIEDRWHTFDNFYNDTKDTWFKGATIDRFPNMSGIYERGNTRWATEEQQNINRISVKLTKQDVLNIRSSALSQSELCRVYEMSSAQISRIITKKRWANI